MKTVLFVCTANRCRSPMAEALFQRQIEQRGEASDWWVDSAGASALAGEPATEFTQQVASERGLDLGGHRSQPADRTILGRFALVLVMEENHRRQLGEAIPEFADRLHLLSEMVGERSDLWDPVGTGLENYRAMANEIERILREGFERIEALADRRLVRGRRELGRKPDRP